MPLNFRCLVLLGLSREDGQNGTAYNLAIDCPSTLLCEIDSILHALEPTVLVVV